MTLLAFDAIHDLAIVRPVDDSALAGRGHLQFRTEELQQGERIYSLGNPLDVGFAVVEGTYNGLVERSFYPTIFFAGSLNPGVSGGPTLDERGRVVGVNVAARRDGEQVSFLVPAAFARDLLARAATVQPLTGPAYAELTAQLTEHQRVMTERFLAQPWRTSGHPRYAVPQPQEDFMRCWGYTTPADTKGLEFHRSECRMDSYLFVTGMLTTGSLSVRHEAYDGRKLGMLRFADRYSFSFANEHFVEGGDPYRVPSQCHERFVENRGLPLRAVLCMSAYRKLRGLYDLSVLVATLDDSVGGVQGRFDAWGVSFDNAMALAAHYLEAYGWTSGRPPAPR